MEVKKEHNDKDLEHVGMAKGSRAIRDFLPDTEYRIVHTITKVWMLLYRNGKISQVVYDKNYKLLEYKELVRREFLTNSFYWSADDEIQPDLYNLSEYELK